MESLAGTKLYHELAKQTIEVSPVFMAVLECVADLPRHTTPSLTQVTWTSDGYLLGRQPDAIGFNDFLGMTREDMVRNLTGLHKCINAPEGELELWENAVFSASAY